uniref:Uncharacterized protein n=1 Tax=Oryza rufipogon TaxID=4529 RepID=A0A0E0RGH8_ORYRU
MHNFNESKIGSREIINNVSFSDGYSNFDTESINNSEFTNDYSPLFFEVFMVGAPEDEQARIAREQEEQRAKAEKNAHAKKKRNMHEGSAI